jgi:outer membrane protein assembly factor BamB
MLDPRKLQHAILACCCCCVLVQCRLIQTSAHADDWPQFLGPARNGQSAEKKLISSFPNDGPKVIWKSTLGVSMSGVAVAGESLFTLFQDDAKQYAVCLKTQDGSEVWKTELAPLYENGMGNGPRATPSISAGKVVVSTGEGILIALDEATGKKLWSVDVPKSLDAKPSEYGMSCSPLIVDSIVNAGSASAAVAGFDLETGKLAWKCGAGNAGYSSPVLMTLAGTTQAVSFTASGVVGINPKTSDQLWSFDFPTEYDCNTANPVQISPYELLISAGENHGSVILKIQPDGKIFRVEEVWSSLGKDSQLRAEWQTPVVMDGHLYGLDNSGSAGPITNLVCIRVKDQKTVWQKNRFGKSNLIAADGKLFLTTMEGEVVIVEASPAAFKELARATVMETTRQAPALSKGRIYVRDDKDVICIDVRSE